MTLTGCPNCGMIATPGNEFILTFSGNGTAYVYDSTADAYVTSRLLIPAPIQGYYGVLGAGPAGAYFLVNGLIVNPVADDDRRLGHAGRDRRFPAAADRASRPWFPIINTGNRNVAALAPLDAKRFLRLTTPVRQNITTVTRDDSRTTLEIVNLQTGEDTLAGVVPENPVVNVFGTTRFNTNPRMMVVDSAGTTAYMITLSGLSVVSLAPTGTDTRPAITTGARGIVNSADGTPNFKPGSFITISGSEPGGRGDRGHDSAAHRAGRILRHLRRHRGAAAGRLERPDSGAGAGHAAGGHARRGSPLAGHRAGVGPGDGDGACQRELAKIERWAIA